MPSNLFGFLDPYLTSPGQPTGGGAFGASAPRAPEVAIDEQVPSQGGWKQGLKNNLGGILGAVGTGLAAKFTGGDPLAALAGFTHGYSNEKLRLRQQREQQEFETSKAMDDRLHKMWQELSAADLSRLPPNLSHLAQSKADFDKKYTAALLDDSPGGKRISPKERSEMLALGAVLQSAIPEVERFKEASVKAEPYTAAIKGGNFEPPPGAEQIAEMGLPDDEATNLAGIEAMRGAELTRAEYDTPQFDPRLGRLISPREAVTLSGQEAMAKRAADALAATEANRLRVDSDRDRAWRAQQEHWNRMDARRAEEDRARNKRYEDLPVVLQGQDAEGNPASLVYTRGELQNLVAAGGQGTPLSITKPIDAASRQKAKETEANLQQVENLIRSYKPEYVGPAGGRAYAFGEKVPEFAQGILPKQMQLDPLRSDFKAQNAAIKNTVVRAITGAQLQGADEAKRILAQIPQDTDNPVVWEAKANRTLKNVQILSQVQRGQLDPNVARTMFDFGELREQGKGGLTPPPTLAPTKPKSDPLGIF